MKLVKEELNFKRGQDPHTALSIGKYDDDYDFGNPEDGDKIELQEDIYDTQYMDSESLNYNGESLTTLSELKDNLLLLFKATQIFDFDLESDQNWYGYDINNNEKLINMHWIIKNQKMFKKLR